MEKARKNFKIFKRIKTICCEIIKVYQKNLGGLIKWTKIQTTAIHKTIIQAKMRITIQIRMRITIQAKTQITTQTKTQTTIQTKTTTNQKEGTSKQRFLF